jgi:small subunit ribosomal protein S16
MATRIRLRRLGAKKRPFYRVVVADQRSPRDGRFIENIGKYHPLDDPSLIEIDEERALHWLRVGAQPSDQVRNLMVKVGIWDRFVSERPSAAALVKTRAGKPVKEKVSKKAAAKAAEADESPAQEVVSSAPADSSPLGDPQADVPEAEESPDVGSGSVSAEPTTSDDGSASDSAAPSEEGPSEEAPEA